MSNPKCLTTEETHSQTSLCQEEEAGDDEETDVIDLLDESEAL